MSATTKSQDFAIALVSATTKSQDFTVALVSATTKSRDFMVALASATPKTTCYMVEKGSSTVKQERKTITHRRNMEKTERLDTKHLKNALHFQFNSEVIDLVTREDPVALNIKPLFDPFLADFRREDVALKRIIKSALTEQIREADKARDETWSGIVEIIHANQKNPDPQKRESARQLRIVTDGYGNLAKLGLNEETSNVYNILQDFSSQRYAAHITRLGLDTWVIELRNRNAVVDTLMKERFDEFAARDNTAFKEIRSDVDKRLNAMLDAIDAHITLDGLTIYGSFVRTYNVIVARYKLYHKDKRHGSHHEENPVEGQDGADI